MNDDDISRLLLEADLGNILPGYQNKRWCGIDLQ
jgi:hypothetical protein